MERLQQLHVPLPWKALYESSHYTSLSMCIYPIGGDPTMVIIELSKTEQEVVKLIALQRIIKVKEERLRQTIYGGDKTPLWAEIHAYGAEIAFCKHYNVFPDLSAGVYNMYDCIVDGKKIDVKHTTRPNGKLMVKAKGWTDPPDYFAMLTGKFPVYRYVGFMPAADLLVPERIDESLPFPAYVATQNELIRWIK